MPAHAASSSPAAAMTANRGTCTHPNTFRGHMRDTAALPARQRRTIHKTGTGSPRRSCANLVNERAISKKPATAFASARRQSTIPPCHIESEGQLSQKVGFLLRDGLMPGALDWQHVGRQKHTIGDERRHGAIRPPV